MTDPQHDDRIDGPHPPSGLLVSASAVGIMAVDAKGIIRSCNPAAEQLLARPSHELVGLPLGFPTVVDDTRIIDVRQSDGGFRANALALIALELENPLAEINRAVHQLRHGTAGTGGHHTEYIDRIDERTQYLLAVVRRLRAATGIDPEQIPANIEPVRVFDVILERLHERRKKSRSVRLRCDAGIVVYVDRTDFAQMLDSYLHNALSTDIHPSSCRPSSRANGWTCGYAIKGRACPRPPGHNCSSATAGRRTARSTATAPHRNCGSLAFSPGAMNNRG